jgi:hypothetical protein
MPTGGKTNQIPVKLSGSDFEFGWVDLPGTLIDSAPYNGNKENAPTAVDISTGTFTAEKHGWVNGTKVFPTPNIGSAAFPLAVYPKGLTQNVFYIVGAASNTFRVSETPEGTPLTFTDAGDLTKWHFENCLCEMFYINIDPPARELHWRSHIKSAKDSLSYSVPLEAYMDSNWLGATPGKPNIAKAGSIFETMDCRIISTGTACILTITGKSWDVDNSSSHSITTLDNTFINMSSPLLNKTFNNIAGGVQSGNYIANGSYIDYYAS